MNDKGDDRAEGKHVRRDRFRSIDDLEQHLHRSGTRITKILLQSCTSKNQNDPPLITEVTTAAVDQGETIAKPTADPKNNRISDRPNTNTEPTKIGPPST